MESQEYDKLRQLEDTYWWHRGRRHLVLQLLDKWLPVSADPKPILDLGCGTGRLLEDLQKRGPVYGVDYSIKALRFSRGRAHDHLVRADGTVLPLQAQSIRAITALDVLEHIENDLGVLQEIRRVLIPDGIAVMTVPAHPQLWSAHDLALHHYRRYTKVSFQEVIEKSGLEIRVLQYGMMLPWIAALSWRKAFRSMRAHVPGPPQPGESPALRARGFQTDEIRLPCWANSSLASVMKLENQLTHRRGTPTGLSLIAVVQTPGQAS